MFFLKKPSLVTVAELREYGADLSLGTDIGDSVLENIIADMSGYLPNNEGKNNYGLSI